MSCNLPCAGSYSGLIIIPTTDTVPVGEMSLEFQALVTEDSSSSVSRFINTEAGLSSRVEAGIDFDLSENASPAVLPNIKYVAPVGKLSAVAVGIASTQPTVVSAPYVVAGRDLRVLRLSGGATRSRGSTDWFAGADRTLGRYTIMADYTSGSSHYSSVGVTAELSRLLSVQLGLQFPNGSGDRILSLTITYTSPWR